MFACFKKLNKTFSSSAMMCIHFNKINCKLFNKINCKFASKVNCKSANSSINNFSWTRISIKFSLNKSKSSRKNSSQSKTKTVEIWKSFWLNEAFNEIDFWNINWSKIQQRWHALDHIIWHAFLIFSLLIFFKSF